LELDLKISKVLRIGIFIENFYSLKGEIYKKYIDNKLYDGIETEILEKNKTKSKMYGIQRGDYKKVKIEYILNQGTLSKINVVRYDDNGNKYIEETYKNISYRKKHPIVKLDGSYTKYDIHGKKTEEGTYYKGDKYGPVKYYYTDGITLLKEERYMKSELDGPVKYYYTDGITLRKEERYMKGELDGDQILYNKNGEKEKRNIYEKGKIKKSFVYKKNKKGEMKEYRNKKF